MRQATEPLKAQRIYLLLRDLILAGDLGPGARLPSEPALAEEHGVSRVTIRRALARLDEEALIERRAGSGTFVRAAAPMVRAAITDMSNVFAHLIEMGRTTEARLLGFDYMTPPAAIREALGLEADERVQRSVRVRTVDGAPFSHLTAHVPERIGRAWSREQLATEPLLGLIEATGRSPVRATQEVSAVLAGPDVADALDVEVGSALVSLTRTVQGADGDGLEHLQALYRPDRYSLRMDLVREGGVGKGRWSPIRPAATGSARAGSGQPAPNQPAPNQPAPGEPAAQGPGSRKTNPDRPN